MNQKTKTNLKNWLPFGGQTDIAKRFHVSQPYVSQVMNGHAKNDAILEALILLAKENKQAQARIKQEFENKVNSI